MNIERELKENHLLLVVLNLANARKAIFTILNKLLKQNNKVLYITTNLSAEALNRQLEKEKISTKNVFFLACTEKCETKESKEREISKYVYCGHSLTDISIAIHTAKLDIKPNVILFDTIGSLAIWNTEETILRFLQHVAHSIRQEEKSKVLLFIEKEQKNILQKTSIFVDKTIEMNDLKDLE